MDTATQQDRRLAKILRAHVAQQKQQADQYRQGKGKVNKKSKLEQSNGDLLIFDAATSK